MENSYMEEDDGKLLWSRILDEVQTNATLNLPANKSLLVLGDVSSGKSALVSRLRGDEAPRRGHGLEYQYLDVADTDREAESRLSVWVLDGDPYHQNLLRFALSKRNFADTLVLLTGSAEAPWALLDSLQQWVGILSRYVDRLGLSPEELREARESLVRQFTDYAEPEVADPAGQQPVASGAAASASAAAVAAAARRAPNPLHPPADPEKVALPLPEGAFACNLGLPIVVVVTKTDAMAGSLEKECDYKEEHFDFLQYHLRCFCLKYGAALVYTSAREDKNCSLLRSYLLNRIYGLSCPHAPYVVERDCVFVPAGWDSQAKAYLLAASTGSLTKDLTNTPFSDVITRPAGLAGGARRAGAGSTPGRGGGGGGASGAVGGGGEAEQAEDEQVFLCRLQAALLKQSAAPAGGTQVGAPPTGGPTGVKPGPKPSATTTSRLPPGGPGGPGAAPPVMGPNDGVLANFFNSLLSKRSGAMPGQPSPGGGPPAAVSPAGAGVVGGGGASAPAKMQQHQQAESPGSQDSPGGPDAAGGGGPVKRVAPPTPAQS